MIASPQEPSRETRIIAENIRSQMAIQQVTLRALSERTAEVGYPISPAQLGRISKAQRSADIDTLGVISQALDLDFSQLFEGVL